MTLIVGAADRVTCVQDTGLSPSSIKWYDPQDQVVSRDAGDEVYQTGGGGRIAYLNFQSYQQSQGGQYECRVNVSGNNSNLSVCIGECYTLSCFVIPVPREQLGETAYLHW